MLKNNRDGPMTIDAMAELSELDELMNKIKRRCGDGAVRLTVVADPDRGLVVTRQDWEDLRQLQWIIAKLFQEISSDQLARLLKSEGLEGAFS